MSCANTVCLGIDVPSHIEIVVAERSTAVCGKMRLVDGTKVAEAEYDPATRTITIVVKPTTTIACIGFEDED